MNYLEPLEKNYRKHADRQRSVAMAKYMKDRFEFFGIMSPIRKNIDREFLLNSEKPQINQLPTLIQEAYRKPQREFQYFINELTRNM